MPTKKQIIDVLKTIPDPELNISLWDLGLIYDVKVTPKGAVSIIMTLTTIGCPLFSTMQGLIEEKIKELPGIISVDIELTFEPPWTMDRMTKDAKALLGF